MKKIMLFGGIFNMVAWLLIVESLEAIEMACRIANAVSDTQKNIKQAQLIDEVNAQLTQIRQVLDESILRDMRVGMQHLLDGLQSDVPHIRDDDFREAHTKFNTLMSLDPNGTTQGTSGNVENARLITLGYWGNFYYFALRGDKRTALIRLYECVLKYPDAVHLFPHTYFNQDYAKAMNSGFATLKALDEQYHKMKGNNSAKRLGYYFNQGVRFSIAGAIASLALPITAFTGGWGASAVGPFLLGYLDKSKVDVPQYEDVESLTKAIQETQTELETAFASLKTECETRLSQLQAHSLDELLQLPAETPPKKPRKPRAKKTEST